MKTKTRWKNWNRINTPKMKELELSLKTNGNAEITTIEQEKK